MSYSYAPLLPDPDSIRLLRLHPTEDESEAIHCDLHRFSLDESIGPLPRYGALSYVWGHLNKSQPIFVNGYHFEVTKNLHGALSSLRHRSIEWLWIDAICINQKDKDERGHQVRSMAKIYGKAHRVIVWLGEAANESELAFDAIHNPSKGINNSSDDTIRQSVVALLERKWFRRIWILQEVAAARRILIACGSSEIDGYKFCVGLKSLEAVYETHRDLLSLVRSVNYLIRQARFRPTSGVCWSDLSFLTIRPLAELLDMFHAHEATERHDKLYALLGMSSDALNEAMLSHDYKLPWKEVYHRVIEFLFGRGLSITTCEDTDYAKILSKGSIIGRICSFVPISGWGDTQRVKVLSKTPSGVQKVWCWNLHTSAKPIQLGDLVYIQRAVSSPAIIRPYNGYFAVIIIAATPPVKVFPEDQGEGREAHKPLLWSTFLDTVSIAIPNILLLWNWGKEVEPLNLTHGGDIPQDVASGRLWPDLGREVSSDKALGLQTDIEKLEMLVMGVRMKILGDNHSDTLASINNPALVYLNQGRLKNAKEWAKQASEKTIALLGNKHPDTLTCISNLATVYWSQGEVKKAEVLAVFVFMGRTKVLGKAHRDTLKSMANLARAWKAQNRYSEAVALMKECLRLREQEFGWDSPDAESSRESLVRWGIVDFILDEYPVVRKQDL